jgi:hypothetical protein
VKLAALALVLQRIAARSTARLAKPFPNRVRISTPYQSIKLRFAPLEVAERRVKWRKKSSKIDKSSKNPQDS